MRFISTHTHGEYDYTVSIGLMMLPWLFHFAYGGPETWVPVILGGTTILYSLFTRYELSVLKWLPFKVHLMLDYLSALLLVASPWILGFSQTTFVPHVVAGFAELGIASMTRLDTGPSAEARPNLHGHA